MKIANNNNKLSIPFSIKNVICNINNDYDYDVLLGSDYVLLTSVSCRIYGVYRNGDNESIDNLGNIGVVKLVVKNGVIYPYDDDGNIISLTYQHNYFKFRISGSSQPYYITKIYF